MTGKGPKTEAQVGRDKDLRLEERRGDKRPKPRKAEAEKGQKPLPGCAQAERGQGPQTAGAQAEVTRDRSTEGRGRSGEEREPQGADRDGKAGEGCGFWRRSKISAWKGRVQMRRWTERSRSLSPEDAGGKGSRPRLEHCAPAARSPGRGGDRAAHSPSDRESRARRAVTGRGSQSSAASAASGASAAAPQHPHPDPRSAASRHPPPPKMASPAPRPPHNAVRRDVTRPRAAGRGSGETEAGVRSGELSTSL